MGHSHEEEHYASIGNGPLVATLGITIGIMVAELVGGLLSNSLALVGDAGHMLTDSLALGLSLFANNLARRPSTLTRTFGYHRVEIMAALANGTILILVSIAVFFEAYQRFRQPPQVHAPLMLVIAVIGLAGNTAGIMLLRKGRHGSLNIKGAFLHVMADAVSSIGVIIAGIIIAITGLTISDPVVATLIGIIILWGAVNLVRESVDILMEAVPRHIEVEDVVKAIRGVPGVEELHDIHVWTITSGINALSAHLMIEDQMVSRSAEVRETVTHLLSDRFDITHTTLQLECSRCETCPVGVVCQITRPNHDSSQAKNEG